MLTWLDLCYSLVLITTGTTSLRVLVVLTLLCMTPLTPWTECYVSGRQEHRLVVLPWTTLVWSSSWRSVSLVLVGLLPSAGVQSPDTHTV